MSDEKESRPPEIRQGTKPTLEGLYEMAPDAMTMDGYDDCIIGLAYRHGMNPVIAYSYDSIINRLIDDGMTTEEAIEYFEVNQLGAWVGEGTPVFIELME